MNNQLHWEAPLQQLGVSLSEQQQTDLLNYLALLQRWNKVYNLTAVRDPEQMLAVHIWDSLSLVPYLQAERLLDVGSGAGLPGIPLAIMQKAQHVSLLDTNGKKTRFMRQAVVELGLKQVEVVQVRVEQWQPPQLFDAIVSRAFASLADFIHVSSAHLAEGGMLYAMKGRYPDAEIAALPQGWQVASVHKLDIPDLDAQRHLLKLSRTV